MSFTAFFLSLLFPSRCLVCDGVLNGRDRAAGLHPACRAKLEPVASPYCLRCGTPLSSEAQEYCVRCAAAGFHFERNFPLWAYSGAARDSVLRFKYHGRQEYARTYARLVWEARGAELERLGAEAVLPVPIHRSRLRKRGYNQAALFAWELSRLLNIPFRGDLLLRTKHTGAQKALGREERFRNMKQAFRVRKKASGLHRVLLADDIYTTGSTLDACALALKEAGAGAVYGVTLCIAEGEK